MAVFDYWLSNFNTGPDLRSGISGMLDQKVVKRVTSNH
tara:strand:+ start:143 stop:256 length:114 start_codon:yes stop_codon:yes gene_type:complete